MTSTTISSAATTLNLELRTSLFEHNLEAVGLNGATRELVTASPPKGEVAHLADGTPVLRFEGQLLGMPSDHSLAIGSPAAIVVFGLGLGHTVRALRSITNSNIVVYEPDPGIVRSMLERGPTDLGDVDIVCTTQDLSKIWSRVTRGHPDATVVRTPGYSQAFPSEERKLTQTVTELVCRVGVNVNTYRVRARVWIQDVLDNLDSLCEAPLFQALAGQYANVPAFIVGAGPSLGKNGELLAEATKKGIVIAVNSSGRALASYGVEPQVLACMESIDVSHLIRDLPFIDRVVRAFSLTGSPKTFATGKGPLLPIYEALPEVAPSLEQLTGSKGLSVCASISTVAFSLAHRLGCSPIVLVGQDLAYTDGKAYARGTPYEGSRVRVADGKRELTLDWCDTLKTTHGAMRSSEPLDEIEAWGGNGRVWSGPGFMPVRAWLEHAADVIRRETPHVRLINATEGGARIGGFEELPLAEVLGPLCEQSITSATIASDAARAKPALSRETVAAWADSQIELAGQIARAAARTRRLARTGEHAIKSGNPRRVNKAFGALERSEAELKKSVLRSRIVEAWCFAELETYTRQLTANPEDGSAESQAAQAMQREAQMASVIETSAQELQAALALVAQRLREK